MAKKRYDGFEKMKLKVMGSTGSFVVLDTIDNWMRILPPYSEVK